MQIDLGGKIALVTGAASGIGRACASLLASAGAFVVVVDVDEAGARETARTIGGQVVHCDVCDPESISAMRDRVISEVGGVDILVNCAGVIVYRTGDSKVRVKEWDRVLAANLRGTFLVCQAFFDNLKEREGGRIVILSSLAVHKGGIDVGVHYTCSKAGLIGLTRSLAKEGGPFGIGVNAVAPGITMTEPVRQHLTRERAKALCDEIPLRRLGESDDIAKAVLFLSSTLADYVTGVVLDVNGGMHMT